MKFENFGNIVINNQKFFNKKERRNLFMTISRSIIKESYKIKLFDKLISHYIISKIHILFHLNNKLVNLNKISLIFLKAEKYHEDLKMINESIENNQIKMTNEYNILVCLKYYFII